MLQGYASNVKNIYSCSEYYIKKKDILKLFYTYFFSYTKLYLLIILATLM